MLILNLAFAVGLRVAGPPSDWTTLPGADKIEYRWSRPANNSCLIEFRSLDPTDTTKFTAVATVTDNSIPPKPKPAPTYRAPTQAPTKVREHHQDRTMLIRVVASGTTAQSSDDCYKVVSVKAEDVSATPSSNNGSSPPATKDKTATSPERKDPKRKPEQ
ncbi:MAG TPA: hypothetical protein VH351_00025 [Bryobacteraceae bacterium]|jgi:hypothetical protein|nr:hypothetical protein [Bryobacteraceae bacterium]